MNHPWVSQVIYRPRIRWLTQQINLTQETSVLDVGCGTGQFLRLLHRQHGSRCLGIDLDPRLIRNVDERGIRLLTADFEEFETDQCFDLITMFHLIEHLSNPAAALAKVSDLLKPGGHLCIETPASDGLALRIFRSAWFPLLAPYHRHVFSRRSLAMVMNEHFVPGLEVARQSIYVPGEMVGSACLPLSRFVPYPTGKRSSPLAKTILALIGIGVVAVVCLPAELAIAATVPCGDLASHQRVLWRKKGASYT